MWNPRDSAVTPLRFIPHLSDSRYGSRQAGLSDALSKGLLRQRTHLPQPRPLSRAVRHGDSVSLSVVYIWGGGQGPRGVAGFVPHASSRAVRHVCLSPGAFECGPLCRCCLLLSNHHHVDADTERPRLPPRRDGRSHERSCWGERLAPPHGSGRWGMSSLRLRDLISSPVKVEEQQIAALLGPLNNQ